MESYLDIAIDKVIEKFGKEELKGNIETIILNLEKLRNDIIKTKLLEKEIGKMKPNANLIEKYEVRHYNLERIEVFSDEPKILESLEKAITELTKTKKTLSKYGLMTISNK